MLKEIYEITAKINTKKNNNFSKNNLYLIEIEEKGNVLIGKKEDDNIQNKVPEEIDDSMKIELDSSPNIEKKEL